MKVTFHSLDIQFHPEHPNFDDEWDDLCEIVKRLKLREAEESEA